MSETPVVVAEIEALLDRDEPVRAAVGILLFCLATYLAEAIATLLLVEDEQRVR